MEPNPDGPLEVARNTNRVAQATPVLAPVPMVALKGSFAKTHLMSFLQCLKAGNVYWNDSKQLMTCPAGQQALADHLEHGMYYEVFTWEAVAEDKDAMRALCESDNYDQAFAHWGSRDGVVEEYV